MMMEKREEIKFEGMPELVELRPDIGVDPESVAFCFKQTDEFTFKVAVSPEVMAIMLGAVRLVRCKDCKWRGCHWNEYDTACHNPRFGDGYGNYSPPDVRDDFFCADGERREKE